MTDPAPFVTADEVTISPDDAVLAASGFIRSICGWHIWPSQADTVTLQPQGGDLLVLPTLKLTGLTSVTVNGYAWDISHVTAWGYGALEHHTDCYADCTCGWGDDGFWSGIYGDYWLHPGWPTWGSVTVEFTHGYADVPPEIRAVCQSLAKRWPLSATPWTTRKMGSASVSIAKGIGTSSPLGDLTVIESMVLDRFTLPSRP